MFRSEQLQTLRGPGDRRELVGDAQSGEDPVDFVVQMNGARLRVDVRPAVEDQAVDAVLRKQCRRGDAGRPGADDHHRDEAGIVVHAYLDPVALRAEIDLAVVGGDARLDDIAVVQVLGVLGLAGEEQLPLEVVGQQTPSFCTGFGGRRQSGSNGGAGHHQVAGGQLLEAGQRSKRLDRPIDHVALDRAVLAQFAVDPQLQAQLAETVELLGVQQHQRWPDGCERRIRLGFVELRFRQLHIARRHIVGHHQTADVVGQVVGGDRGADRHVAADHQTDLHLVVEQADMLRLDDVVDGASDRPRCLAKERERHRLRVHPVSSTWEAKLVICATTRHGAVTGASRSKLFTATVSVLAAARSIAARSASSCAVVVAAVSTLATASAVPAHQASEVR